MASLKDSFIVVDTGFKVQWAEEFENSVALRKAYPVSGGERCKSIDRVFELINSMQNVDYKIKKIIAIGGGSLVDLCGYACMSSLPDVPFEVFPTTPFSQLSGFYNRRFYLNYDRKKNRLSVQGTPNMNHIYPDLLRTYKTDDIREAHLAAYSVALGFDERFYHLVRRSLNELVHDKIDWDHFSEIIWESNFLRAKAADESLSVFPGETMADFIQNATGLQADYLSAFSTGIRIELYLAFRMGYIDEFSYSLFDRELCKLLVFKKNDFDFQTLIMNVRRQKQIYMPLIKAFGKSVNTRIESPNLEDLLISFFSEKS